MQFAVSRIIDPTKMVRVAPEDAVSVASVLLLTEAAMTDGRKERRNVASPIWPHAIRTTGTATHKALREATQVPERIEGAEPSSAARSARRKPERPRVGWIAKTAIILMLLIGAGWELLHWLLLIMSMD